MVEQKTLVFVIAVLYSLKEKWRGIGFSESFENTLRGRCGVNIHTAWLRLKKDGILGEYGNEFQFDTLYEVSNLSEILSDAVGSGLVRLGGSDLCYHLDHVSPEVLKILTERQNISGEMSSAVAQRLNELLEEQERSTRTPVNL
jgi:hypothetical protein